MNFDRFLDRLDKFDRTLSNNIKVGWCDFKPYFDNIGIDLTDKPFSLYSLNTPRINMWDNDDERTIEIFAAGYAKEDFKIHFLNDKLTISGQHKYERPVVNMLEYEYLTNEFKREYTLKSNEYDTDKIVAEYKDGVLTIRIARLILAQKKSEAKTIEVK